MFLFQIDSRNGNGVCHRKIKAARENVIIKLVTMQNTGVQMADVTSTLQGVHVTARDPDQPADQVGKSSMSGPHPSSEQVRDIGTPLTGTYTTEFSSRHPSDKKDGLYEVQRMVTLPDDRVVVLDFLNYKLKLFSADYQYQGCIQFDANTGPLGLTVINQSTVAVSSTDNNTITLYNVQADRLKKSKQIRCQVKDGGRLFDTSYGENVFVCLVYHYKRSQRSVDIITMSGQAKEITRENGRWSLGHHVKAGDGDCFYVTSGDPDLVSCFSYDGRQLWSVSTDKAYKGITLARGMIFAVLYKEGKVCQISLDGRRYDNDVLHGLTHPYTACYQRQRNRLLVSCNREGEPIKVYKLD